MASFHMANAAEMRLTYIIPSAMLAILVGILFKSVTLGVILGLFPLYHTVLYYIDKKKHRAERKAIKAVLDRSDISISIKELSHTAEHTIFEAHTTSRHGRAHAHATKLVKFFHFASGSSWRIPNRPKHYAWSRDYYLSTEGLENIAVGGNEFYYVALQGHPDIAYVYPCKFFTLDDALKEKLAE